MTAGWEESRQQNRLSGAFRLPMLLLRLQIVRLLLDHRKNACRDQRRDTKNPNDLCNDHRPACVLRYDSHPAKNEQRAPEEERNDMHRGAVDWSSSEQAE